MEDVLSGEEALEHARAAAIVALDAYVDVLRAEIASAWGDHRIKHLAECSIRVDRALDGMKRLDAKHN
jgi:hypothetical protein